LTFVLAEIVNDADVRVVDGGGSAGFTLEALQRSRVVDQFGRQKFEGDKPTQVAILGTVDNAHATAAKPV
jgi:hypothetical protein